MVDSLDDRVTVWVATHRWAPLDPVFIGLGTIEKLGAVWVVLALIAGYYRWRRVLPTLGIAVLTALVLFAADAATFGIKDVVARPRPFVTHPEIHPLYHVRSSSFPAGHAATAFAGAVLLSGLAPRWRVAFLFLASAVAFSRIYVGDHYLGDVLGGAIVGAAIALVAQIAVSALLPRFPRTLAREPFARAAATSAHERNGPGRRSRAA
jgi:undecaprenyl-diphosphatase